MSRRPPDWRQGAQLAAAVLLSHAVAVVFSLPEAFWSVMSVLIVMRGDTGSTLAAGWERVRSTGGGALIGLGGVWLLQQGLPRDTTTLLVTAALAGFTGALPGWRGLPIAALIVLGSRGGAGHSAVQVAALRVMQILIGVGAALLVAFIASRIRPRDRLQQGCANVLRGLAARWAGRESGTRRDSHTALHDDTPSRDRGQALRDGLARLAQLAEGADQGEALLRRWRARTTGGVAAGTSTAPPTQSERVQALARSCHHLSSLQQLLAGVAPPQRARTAGTLARALHSASQALSGTSSLALDGLDALAAAAPQQQPHLAGPLHLLARDLRVVCGADPAAAA
jgi:uncharacterized membrane protein YccC